jgi:hypothetical protein
MPADFLRLYRLRRNFARNAHQPLRQSLEHRGTPMTASRKTLRTLLASAGLTCALVAQAQTTTTVILDVCRGKAVVTEQQQDAAGLRLAVEVTVENCDGVCTGSLEYSLRLQDADGRQNVTHLTENWHWQDVGGPFTLEFAPDIAPGLQLQEVVSMQIGRCSCSTGGL